MYFFFSCWAKRCNLAKRLKITSFSCTKAIKASKFEWRVGVLCHGKQHFWFPFQIRLNSAKKLNAVGLNLVKRGPNWIHFWNKKKTFENTADFHFDSWLDLYFEYHQNSTVISMEHDGILVTVDFIKSIFILLFSSWTSWYFHRILLLRLKLWGAIILRY